MSGPRCRTARPRSRRSGSRVEGDRLAIFTGPASVKARNLRRDGRIAISVVDEVNPYRGVMIRGPADHE